MNVTVVITGIALNVSRIESHIVFAMLLFDFSIAYASFVTYHELCFSHIS